MTDDKNTPDEDVQALKKKIIRQVEFYFGDYNLMRDKFMLKQMKENDGWFDMGIMLQFKRLASICSEPATILEALEDADKTLLEVDKENKRIRRKSNRVIPDDNAEFRKAFKARTVHVKGFQSEESIDDIQEFLSDFGKIDGIQLHRLPDKKFKGSLFVTFSTQAEAEKFINAPMVYYKSCELSKMTRQEFYDQLETERKNKKQQKDEEEERIKWRNLLVIKVSGITDDTIIHRDVKDVFQSKGVSNILFFDRFEKLGEEGYLVFESDKAPETFLEESGFANGEKATVKSATIEFTSPNEEEKTKILNLFKQAKAKLFDRPPQRGKGKFHKRNASKKERGKKTTFDSDGEGDGEPKEKAAKLD